MYCKRCGTEIQPGQHYCPRCSSGPYDATSAGISSTGKGMLTSAGSLLGNMALVALVGCALITYAAVSIAVLYAMVASIEDAQEMVASQDLLPAALLSAIYLLLGFLPSMLGLLSACSLLKPLIARDASLLSRGSVRRALFASLMAIVCVASLVLEYVDPDLGRHAGEIGLMADAYGTNGRMAFVALVGAAVVLHFAKSLANHTTIRGGSFR